MSLSDGLVGHWPLQGDARDVSGNGRHGISAGVDFSGEGLAGERGGSARFDGRRAYIEVPPGRAPAVGAGDFTIAGWVKTEERLADAIGDIASQYDPASRTGFNFGILTATGVTSHQPNFRHAYFGIDNGSTPVIADCGRPGNSRFVLALAVHEGALYAGTYEEGEHEAGRVYRYAGGTEWIDCGAPDPCNSVMALAVHGGKLYAGVSRYRASGSALPDSPNQRPGGRIYRYEGPGRWVDCGALPGADSVICLTEYQGSLYATPLYSQGVFRYLGGTSWEYCGTPGRRLFSLAVYDGALYAAGNEGGGVFRYDGGTRWTPVGFQPDMTQIYSFAVYQGALYVGAWPEAIVFRYDGGDQWTPCGRLGDEKEVMGMMVYNGALYAGTLPSAEVYRYDGGSTWSRVGLLDDTPGVRYRRAWSMATYQGRLYCGTLPSGRVLAIEAGALVSQDDALPPGWRHVAAVRNGARLRLYVDGRLAAETRRAEGIRFDLSQTTPLYIGKGAQDHFCGSLRDLRVYDRALTESEVRQLAADR